MYYRHCMCTHWHAKVGHGKDNITHIGTFVKGTACVRIGMLK